MKSGKAPKVAIVGSLNIDMVVTGPKLPRPGETVIGETFAMVPGGKGGNQAVAAAMAGADVAFLGKVGNDELRHIAIDSLRTRGINPRSVLVADGASTGVALINVDGNGENAISVCPGANALLCPADVAAFADEIRGAELLLLQHEVPMETVCAAATIATDAGVKVVLNPAPAAVIDDALLKCVDIITPNQTEAELITGQRVGDDRTAAEQAARTLMARGVATVIVTMGRHGALVVNGDDSYVVPAFPVHPVDTVAAGDVFNGALVAALAEGNNLADGARFGTAAAAIAVTRHGAQTSIPTRNEIEAFLQQDAGVME